MQVLKRILICYDVFILKITLGLSGLIMTSPEGASSNFDMLSSG